MKAVIYGCKSSPDEKESVADQHRLVRQAVEREGRAIAGTFGEANQSGYRKERGAQLEAAMQEAIKAAAEHGEAELWVWHSSRLARGDGTKGKRSIQKIVADLLYEDVTVRSVADPEMVTPMLSGIASMVANRYSEDLAAHVTRGIAKRQHAGKPFGGVPCGYRVEKTIVDGEVIAKRVIDPAGAAVCEAIWSGIEAGHGWGPLARSLNATGFRTKRGNPWTPPVVRDLAKNAIYVGEQGYPPLIDRERWERIQSLIDGSTPVSRQRQQGGRYATADALLKGIAFCLKCGSPMHLRSDKTGYYTCRAKRRGTGLCDAKAIPIPVVDERVLSHLDTFVGSVEQWIAGRVAERTDQHEAHEHALRREEAALSDAQRLRAKLMAEYERQVADDRPTAYLALEAVEAKDRECSNVGARIEAAQARLEEWQAAPDINAALDYYEQLVAAIRGRVTGAGSVREVNAALSTMVAGIWLGYDGQRLVARFALHPLDGRDDLDLMSLPPTNRGRILRTRSIMAWRGPGGATDDPTSLHSRQRPPRLIAIPPLEVVLEGSGR